MKKKSLGARLLRSQDELRQARHKEAVNAARGSGPLVNLDSNSQILVAQMFESARSRIAAIVELGIGRRDVRVILGKIEPSMSGSISSDAIDILSAACWPMTIPEGIQLSANPFYYEWVALTDWAKQEELTVEIEVETGEYIAETAFHVVAKPR